MLSEVLAIVMYVEWSSTLNVYLPSILQHTNEEFKWNIYKDVKIENCL